MSENDRFNKAQAVREALDLSPAEAGRLLLGYPPGKAHETWLRWESGETNLPDAVRSLFDVVLLLSMMRDFKTPNAWGALDLILETLKFDDIEQE